MSSTLVLIAKQPLPGKAKTRLHPPLTLAQAAEFAAACIDDTIAAMEGVPAARRVIFFQGDAVPPSARGFDFIAQPEGTLDEKLSALFDEVSGPTVLIGMDTPQVTPQNLAPAFENWPDEIDAWFGPAADGGFWALGLRDPRGDLIRGVPMSRIDTGTIQLQRLVDAGLRVGILDLLTDIDEIADARSVAAAAPHTRMAALLRMFGLREFAAS